MDAATRLLELKHFSSWLHIATKNLSVEEAEESLYGEGPAGLYWYAVEAFTASQHDSLDNVDSALRRLIEEDEELLALEEGREIPPVPH